MTQLLMFIGVWATMLWSAQSLQAQGQGGSDPRQKRSGSATVQQQGQAADRRAARVERGGSVVRSKRTSKASSKNRTAADDSPPPRRHARGLPTPLTPNGTPERP